MRAAIATRPGPPQVLTAGTLPDPELAPHQVRVAVETAATTFIDTQLRAGTGPRPLPAEAFPLVLGNGVGGVVTEVGAEVDPAWHGTRVIAATGGRGGYASQAVVAATELHPVPAALETATAIALLADGRTALALANAARIRPGETVAVTAAAGGVGSLLVQLARDAGASVVALAGGRRKLDHARALGAEIALDYLAPDWPAQLDAVTGGLDVVFDGVGGAVSQPLAYRLRAGGRYLPHGMASGSWGRADPDRLRVGGVQTIPLTALGTDAAAQYLLVETALDLALAGTLRPTVGLSVPLAEAAEAHVAMEARTVLGKTLLVV